MSEKEFVNLKIEWLIRNDRINLIESFLKQNEQFDGKSKAVQYLVDKNIASGKFHGLILTITPRDSYLKLLSSPVGPGKPCGLSNNLIASWA